MPIVRNGADLTVLVKSIARTKVFDAHQRAADRLTEELSQAAPVSGDEYWDEDRFGGVHLPDNIRLEEEGRPATGRGSATFQSVVVMPDYGWFQNTGTGGHAIEGDLSWIDDEPRGQNENAGPPFNHFFTEVWHPGSSTHVGWVDNVLERWDDLVAEELGRG